MEKMQKTAATEAVGRIIAGVQGAQTEILA